MGDALMQLTPFLMIGVLFYFLVIMPHRKEQNQHQDMLKNLKTHDRVLTDGGIIGKITNQSSNGKELTISTGNETRLTIVRSAVKMKLAEPSATAESPS